MSFAVVVAIMFVRIVEAATGIPGSPEGAYPPRYLFRFVTCGRFLGSDFCLVVRCDDVFSAAVRASASLYGLLASVFVLRVDVPRDQTHRRKSARQVPE